MRSLDAVRTALEGLGRVQAHGRSLKAPCPAHDDRNPSLSVDWRDGKTLIRCHAGCQTDDIVAALGLELGDLFDEDPPEPGGGIPVRSYVYADWKGDPWIIKDRHFPKSFQLRLPGTQPGDRTGLNGRRPVLFRLPQLLAAKGRRVLYVEGEKDVETAEKIGEIATTQPYGAGAQWHDAYTEAFTRAAPSEVWIVRDNDQRGLEHAADVRMALRGAGLTVRVMAPKAGKDLTDHVEAGHGIADLVPETAIFTRPKGMTGNEIMDTKFPPLRWVVRDLLPSGLALLAAPGKSGKALALDTPLLTTDGWTTMGEVRVGQKVFALDGTPTEVVAATEAMTNHDCFEVVTRSGARLVADAEHQWEVHRESEKKVKTTRELFEDTSPRRWLLPVADEVRSPDVPLPIDPWILGYWVGNGCHVNGQLSCNPQDQREVVARVRDAGYEIGRVAEGAISVLGLMVQLRELGVLGNKHIPEHYLLAGTSQRRELLTGLCDADSYCTTRPNGSPEFELTQVSRNIIDGAAYLARSLGFKVRVNEGRATLNGRDMGPKYRFQLSASRDNAPVSFPRRVNALPERAPAQRSNRDAICSIQPVESVPVRCIQVAHSSGTYLAGAHLTVTHNSWMALDIAVGVACGGIALGGVPCNRGSVLYLAREDGYRRIQSRMDLIVSGTETDLSTLEVIPAEVEWAGGEQGVGALEEWAEQAEDSALVVLDTLAKVEPAEENGDRYKAEYAMMARYKRFADRNNCCVLIVHHDRKSTDDGGDIFTRISGTRGITGAADTMMYLERKRGEPTGFLHVTGRDVTDQQLEIVKSGPLWQTVDRIERAHLRAVESS